MIGNLVEVTAPLDDAAAEVLVCQLLERQAEGRNLDYKAALAFDKQHKGKLLKCIMAFANTRDGGYILVGVSQQGARFEPKGVTDEQVRSFDTTKIGDFARNHCSVLPRVTPREVVIDGCRLLLVHVAEFTDEPIVCTSDLHDAEGKPILRKGHVYVRTEDARCVEIDTSETMRALLDLALAKRGEGLIAQIRRLVGTDTVVDSGPGPSELYVDELAAAQAMFEREGLAGPDAYFSFTVIPAVYDRERISRSRLREIRLQSEVSLRGWNFPHTDRERNGAFEDGLESVTHWGHHHEANRFYTSGLFTWHKALREDGSENRRGTISYVSAIYSLLEMFVFASRYAPMVADTGDFIATVALENIGDRQLSLDNYGVSDDLKSTAATRFGHAYRAPVEQLRASWREYATDASHRLFELFELDVPTASIEQWQSKLLALRS